MKNEREMRYSVSGISLPIRASEDDVLGVAGKSLLKFFSKEEIKELHISRRSVDARRKNDVRFVYGVSATVVASRRPTAERLAAAGIAEESRGDITAVPGTEPLGERPVVVGFGPCGMFCAYILALYGYKPVVIERGSDTAKRRADVENFKKNQVLDPESNIQFGAGGAGTFSDGKLMTRIGDPLCSFVVETFRRFGAPEDIIWEAKPHIGTDYLCGIVDGIRDELLHLGADIYFDTKLAGVTSSLGSVTRVVTSAGEIPCGALVLALGHSARDTVKMLLSRGFSVQPKAFSVGTRIEHLQERINYAMYGKESESGLLPPAEYAISAHVGGRGVYTFCMCPGGEVASAASEEYGIVTNGMSRHARNGTNANSAVCVSVLPEDYGATVDGAMDLVRSIEQAAYRQAGNTYFAPAQTVGSFLGKTSLNAVTGVVPTYMDGKVTMCDISAIFPGFVSDALKAGLPELDRKIKGFAANDAILTAPETRTSSPVRFCRGDDRIAVGFSNVYACGEGAGYAGGITSAAVDGIKCALSIISRYRPAEK